MKRLKIKSNGELEKGTNTLKLFKAVICFCIQKHALPFALRGKRRVEKEIKPNNIALVILSICNFAKKLNDLWMHSCFLACG